MSNPSIVQADVFTALRSFIMLLIPAVGSNVIQGLQNDVATPVGEYITITPLYKKRLSTNIQSWSDPYPTAPGSWNFEERGEYAIQIDCYGPDSADWAMMIGTMWRSEYAVTNLGPNICPLYADDAKQMPQVDGEENYEQRWMIEAHIQYNPVTTVPIQFFTTIGVTLHEVQ